MATAKISLHEEIEKALQNVAYGSIEIYVQNKVVTQITVRNIKKTSVNLSQSMKTVNVSAQQPKP